MYRRLKDGLHYIYAEYCAADLFTGWWLYASPLKVSEGRLPYPKFQTAYPDPEAYVWLTEDWRLRALYRVLGLPERLDYRNTGYEHEFLKAYPTGVLVNCFEDGGRFEVMESEALWDYHRWMRESQLREMREVRGEFS